MPVVRIIWDCTSLRAAVIPSNAGSHSLDGTFRRVCGVDSHPSASSGQPFRGNARGPRRPCVANHPSLRGLDSLALKAYTFIRTRPSGRGANASLGQAMGGTPLTTMRIRSILKPTLDSGFGHGSERVCRREIDTTLCARSGLGVHTQRASWLHPDTQYVGPTRYLRPPAASATGPVRVATNPARHNGTRHIFVTRDEKNGNSKPEN